MDSGDHFADPQEVAHACACTMAKAVGQLAGPGDGEIVVILRASVDMDGASESDLFYSWDWFWRPKTEKAAGGKGLA
jgi:hypothetical protein